MERISNIDYSHPDGYDVREVNLKVLHNITFTSIKALLKEIPQKSQLCIADMGCGDGYLEKELINWLKHYNSNIVAVDISEKQLDRAQLRLCKNFNDYISFIHDDIRKLNVKKNTYDIIIAKMVLHEMKNEEQIIAIRNFWRLLKPGGKLFLWDFFLEKDAEEVIRDIIRKKDILLNLKKLAEDREFITFDQFLDNLHLACSHLNYKVIYENKYIFSTYKRLNLEFNNNQELLFELNKYIKLKMSELSENTLKKIAYNVKKNDISFVLNSKIILLWK